MSARGDLATALAAALPAADYTVKSGAPGANLTIRSNTIPIYITRRTVAPAAINSGFQNSLEVWVLTGAEDYDTAEDALDVALADVLAVLDANNLQFDNAERGTFNETWHGYKLSLTLYTKTP